MWLLQVWRYCHPSLSYFPVFSVLSPFPVSFLPSLPSPSPFLLPVSSPFFQGGRYSRDAWRRWHGESKDTRLSQYHDLPSHHLPALQQLNIRLRPHLDSGLNASAVLFSTNNHSFAQFCISASMWIAMVIVHVLFLFSFLFWTNVHECVLSKSVEVCVYLYTCTIM